MKNKGKMDALSELLGNAGKVTEPVEPGMVPKAPSDLRLKSSALIEGEKVLNVRMPEHRYFELQDLALKAKRCGMGSMSSMNKIMNVALEEFIDNHKVDFS